MANNEVLDAELQSQTLTDNDGNIWKRITIGKIIMGYQRQCDTFCWPGNPLIPTPVKAAWVGYTNKPLLPPSTIQLASNRNRNYNSNRNCNNNRKCYDYQY